MHEIIKQLRASLPQLLTIEQYCNLTGRSRASAYNDMRRKPGLAIKVVASTRVIRDRVLDDMARHPWVPQKDRVSAVPKKSKRPRKRRGKQPLPPRGEDPEVRP